MGLRFYSLTLLNILDSTIMKIAPGFQFPENYQAAVLSAADAPLDILTKQFDDLKHGEVWIQIKASPINPSDLAMLQGTYPHKKTYPFVPGLEASGIVVASGGGFMANFLLGKRVACSASEYGDGTWAAFMKVKAGNCIPLIKALTFEEAASAIVNPMTALALIERVKQSGYNAFVNTAAAGALGKMIIKLAKQENLVPINIVRRAEQVVELQNIGGEIVLDSSLSDFEKTLEESFAKQDPRIILDAIGGEFPNVLLSLAPAESTLVTYASLSKEFLHLHPAPIIRFGKKVEGFHLAQWSSKQSKLKLIKTTRKAQKLIADGTLASHIHQTFSLTKINASIAVYSKEMSKGKWVLVF